MIVPEKVREFLRERMDDPGPEGSGKVVANKIGISRGTLYSAVAGNASCMTMRRVLRAYPFLCTTWTTDSLNQSVNG